MRVRAGWEKDFMRAVRQGVRAAAGRRLTPCLRRWRQSFGGVEEPPGPTPRTERFLIRYGLLDAGAEPRERLEKYAALLDRLARGTGEAPGLLDAWLNAFAGGEVLWREEAPCGESVRCTACPLCETCRFLLSGARPARLSGAVLARELSAPDAPEVEAAAGAELLAFLFSARPAGAAAVARAEALLKACRGVRGVLAASPENLRGHGLSAAEAARIRAARELFELWTEESAPRGQTFRCGQDFYAFYRLRLRDLKKEHFFVVCLDQKNRLLGEELVSAGSLTEALVHPREVFYPAIRARAAAVAVIHNHPSGDPAPSSADREVTRQLRAAARLLGIRFLDHVVVGDGRYVSFVESGLLRGE